MGGFERSNNPIDELGRRLRDLELQIRLLTHADPFRIPVRATDPDVTEPINMWLFPDGRLRARHWNPGGTAYVIREWVPTAAGSSTSATAPAAAKPAPISYQKVYVGTWSDSYKQDGTKRTDVPGLLEYGYADATNGRCRSLVGFDHATIATDLASSTVHSVYLTMLNRNAVWPTSTTVYLGVHNFSSSPASWAGAGIPESMVQSEMFTPSQQRTIKVPLTFATRLRDGTGKGIALEVPSDDPALAGSMSGYGTSYTVPMLTVNYAK